jgi:hypothetical protein
MFCTTAFSCHREDADTAFERGPERANLYGCFGALPALILGFTTPLAALFPF